MPTLQIDGQAITVDDGLNVIQAAETIGVEIPHYCYHPGLTVAGNCRMCLVEIEKMPKLQIACNTRASEGMVVHTSSERVKHARGAVLEFLLINHPVDCPVCDQAGECKLQDYYMDHDRQASRFPLEAKIKKRKAVEIGPLVMLDQERCILCTRCTRFLDEVSGTGELGIFERGDHCQIDLFPGTRLESAYSGNVVDICPVGALTSRDFRFQARVWYLDHTSSVCPSCATGCNIDVHHRRGKIFRFRPRHNEDVNRYWMCDEGRQSYKRYQGEDRLLRPARRDATGWTGMPWSETQSAVGERLRAITAEHGVDAVAGVISAQATNEEIFLFSRWIRDVIGGRVVGFRSSEPDASHDDFLIDADKNPNSAGLRVLGIDASIDTLLDESTSVDLRAVVLFATDLVPSRGEEFLGRLRSRVDFLVGIDWRLHATGEVADVLLPIGTFAETDGTFVNRASRVQRVRAAFAPAGEAKPGWLLLGELAQDAGGPPAPPDASTAFAQLAAAVEPLRELSYEQIGSQGHALV